MRPSLPILAAICFLLLVKAFGREVFVSQLGKVTQLTYCMFQMKSPVCPHDVPCADYSSLRSAAFQRSIIPIGACMKQPDFHSQAILQNIFLLENIQGGIVYSDYEAPFYLRYASEGMAQLSGYTRDELLHMTQGDLVHPDDMADLTDDVGKQLAVGNTFEVEYRLKRKDGSYVYVLDRAKAVEHDGGGKYIHCLLTDITELKELEQALRLSEEKYRIAMQQNGCAILEYDPIQSTLSASENYERIFGGVAPTGTLDDFVRSKRVAAAYAGPLKALFCESVRKKKSAAMELQVLGKNDRYAWCSLHLTPLTNIFGHVYAVVGCLQNIDVRKRRMDELTELSQKDGLTSTYNRVTMEAFINTHLASGETKGRGALIILDIDGFKSINDTLGHDAGDGVLVRLVGEVRKLLSPGHLLGRLGGDEFLIFIPDAEDMSTMERFAMHIVEKVRESFQDNPLPVTTSLGVAFCCGEHIFKTLYQKADAALYIVKKNGRNGFYIHGCNLSADT